MKTSEQIYKELSDKERNAIKALEEEGWEISDRPWLEDADISSFVGRALIAVCKPDDLYR